MTDVVAAARRLTSRVSDGWIVVGAGALVLATQAALIIQALGSYAVELREEFAWSNTAFAIAFTFNRAESGLLGPVQGWALNRFGSRRVMRVGSLIALVGFVFLSQVQSPVTFVLAVLVVSVGAGFCGFLTVITETVKWFVRNRSRALSITAIGLAVGGLVSPLVVASFDQIGWRATAVVSGVVLVIAVAAASTVYGATPPPEALLDERPGAHSPRLQRDFTAAEAARTRAFWLIAFGHSAALLVVGAVIAHLALYLTQDRDMSLQAASFVVAAVPIAQIGGMLLGGYVGDRLTKRWVCAGAMLGHMVGLLCLAFATGAWMIWAFVVLHGVSWGVRGPLMGAIRADYFGASSFGQIMGYSSLIIMIGSVGGPLVAGILADQTGSFRLGFTVLALTAGAASTLFALATPPRLPSSEPAGAASAPV
jgi:MFS family permease